ncbi:MAG: hypothetical protein LLF98_01890 [Clostridium sp.]|uniref:hypothetical protein n=1 Tax=Clostridium sp. TaxID=1506 RepID=UPI0025C3341E|nr:hypothetical protein [Clostridium sp.]MCE5220032.1 hypothetical protein [Clostridium sp.]
MRSEKILIELQKENQKLKIQNDILDTALLNACQTICRELNYSQDEIIQMKNKYIERVKDFYDYE